MTPLGELAIKNPYLSFQSAKRNIEERKSEGLYTSKAESDGKRGLDARFTFGELGKDNIAALSRTGNFYRPSDATEAYQDDPSEKDKNSLDTRGLKFIKQVSKKSESLRSARSHSSAQSSIKAINEIADKSIEILNAPDEMLTKGEWCPGDEAIEPMIIREGTMEEPSA